MEIKTIEERIAKKEKDIEKIEKRIAKWEKARTEEGFIKDTAQWYSDTPKKIKTFDQLVDAWLERNNQQSKQSYDNGWTKELKVYNRDEAYANVKKNLEDYFKDCDDELRYANRDLEEAKAQLENYKNMLEKETGKKDELQTNKVEVIWEFLLNWKKEVIDFWSTVEVKYIQKFLELNKQSVDLHNNHYSLINSGKYTEETYKKKANDLREKEKAARKNVNELVYKFYNVVTQSLDMDSVNKFLDKEVEARYFKLVNDVKKITGNITDARHLSISSKGDLNGYIVGELGTAKVQTIGAGGYNIQCFHYRTLVREL